MNYQDIFDNQAPVKFVHYKQSAETRAKIAAASRNRSAETRAKISAANKGKPKSAEAKLKSGQAKRKLIQTPMGQFRGAKEASIALGVHPRSIQNWLKTKPADFYHVA